MKRIYKLDYSLDIVNNFFFV